MSNKCSKRTKKYIVVEEVQRENVASEQNIIIKS